MRSYKDSMLEQECRDELSNLQTIFNRLEELDHLNQQHEKLMKISYMVLGFAGGFVVGMVVMLLRGVL